MKDITQIQKLVPDSEEEIILRKGLKLLLNYYVRFDSLHLLKKKNLFDLSKKTIYQALTLKYVGIDFNHLGRDTQYNVLIVYEVQIK